MGSTGSGSDWFSGFAAAGAGGGILTMALFPFAIPILLLTLAALLPFLVPLIALAAIAAILKGAWLIVRTAGRGIRRLVRGPRDPDGFLEQAETADRGAPRGVLRHGVAAGPRSC